MANASYTNFKNQVMDGEYALMAAVIKVALVRSYTFNASHAFMSQVTAAGGVVNGTPIALTNVTIGAAGIGIVDADDVTITTTSNASAHSLIVYQASAVTGGADVAPAAQKLIWYFDTGTNLPVTPGTGSLTVVWPNTTNRIYKLG